jgi:hypothetical protein
MVSLGEITGDDDGEFDEFLVQYQAENEMIEKQNTFSVSPVVFQ